MKIFKLLFALFFAIAFVFVTCKPEDNGNDQNRPDETTVELVFSSLTADKDILNPGETATITAEASGQDIIYQWTATSGSLIGSGKTVTYTPTPCITGEIAIVCKVEDKYKKSLTKSITITVQ